MALDANIAACEPSQPRGIHNAGARRLLGVRPSRSVALFTTYVPFRHLLRADVVIDRMASVAQRTRRTLVIRRGIERRPPIRFGRDVVRAPDLMLDVPLRGQRKIIVAHFLEVALLPLAPV